MKLGRIEVGGGLTLDATITEATLLRDMPEAQPLVHNGAHRSYLLPMAMLNGRTFRPSVYFTDGRITSVDLAWADPANKGGSPWENFSFERERDIAKADAAWLVATLGGVGSTTSTYTFNWGTIWSGCDERSGFSSIVVRYDQHERG